MPLIYFSLIVKSRTNTFLEPTSTNGCNVSCSRKQCWGSYPRLAYYIADALLNQTDINLLTITKTDIGMYYKLRLRYAKRNSPFLQANRVSELVLITTTLVFVFVRYCEYMSIYIFRFTKQKQNNYDRFYGFKDSVFPNKINNVLEFKIQYSQHHFDTNLSNIT